MTKRILAALLALTAALLVAAVVPLAVKATQHVQESYEYAAQAAAHSLAAIAVENIDANRADPRFQATLGELLRARRRAGPCHAQPQHGYRARQAAGRLA